MVTLKEPQPQEYTVLRPDLALFTDLHLAAYPEVGHALPEAGTTALAYGTVQLEDGRLPLSPPAARASTPIRC